MTAILYHVHDPMCSWCWGYRPTWQRIVEQLPDKIQLVSLLGGLAPDSDQPMPDEMQSYLQQAWRKIAQQLGTEFNFDFWQRCQPRRSTYPACRAVIAAARQQAGDAMTLAIQQAYYLRAMNPSDDDTLLQLAGELGLDNQRFAADLADPATQAELETQIALARRLGADSFPSLVYLKGDRPQNIAIDYLSAESTLAALIDCQRDEIP